MSRPIFVIGRQHSGNTMLTRCLGRVENVFAVTGEGQYFEERSRLQRAPASEQGSEMVSVLERSGVDLDGDDRAYILERLSKEAAEMGRSERVAADDLYACAMDLLAARRGAERWAQKATSYIFHVNAILETFPEAHLVFLARNPFDLAASMKRRNVWHSVARMIYGWNTGVRQALEWAAVEDDRFTIVRYEDFVQTPVSEMERICRACSLDFKKEYLDVPHVNPSESPYRTESVVSGIDSSRAFYFRKILSAREQATVSAIAEEKPMDALYPDLAQEISTSVVASAYAGVLALYGAVEFGSTYASAFWRDPRQGVERVLRRIKPDRALPNR